MLNIDHHHDNTRFGTINLVDVRPPRRRRSSSSSGNPRRRADPGDSSALYVGLVTDTGRFMYSNTDARAHRMAAALIEAWSAITSTSAASEHVPIEKLKLIARALAKIEMKCDGALAITYLLAGRLRGDWGEREADGGVIDYLRSVEGIRSPPCSATKAATREQRAR
jgi:phosphoesterase RecJ-like protein